MEFTSYLLGLLTIPAIYGALKLWQLIGDREVEE